MNRQPVVLVDDDDVWERRHLPGDMVCSNLFPGATLVFRAGAIIESQSVLVIFVGWLATGRNRLFSGGLPDGVVGILLSSRHRNHRWRSITSRSRFV